jgi:hypothetical protein
MTLISLDNTLSGSFLATLILLPPVEEGFRTNFSRLVLGKHTQLLGV